MQLAHAQIEPTSFTKQLNSLGFSFDIGGKMEKAPDITTFSDSDIDGYARAIGKKNIGFSVFWEHQWNFTRKSGLLFGAGISMTAFDYDIAFKNPVFFEIQTEEHILGNGFRNSFFSLDLPLYYTRTFETKYGEINPFLGITMRNIAYIINQGRNHGGNAGQTLEMSNGDTSYFNAYNIRYGTRSISPIFLPTFGVRWSKALDNGARINVHFTAKLFLDNSNSVEVYLNNYDNRENNATYFYYGLGQEVYNADGELVGPKQSIYFRINMSSFNMGVSYTFK